MVSGDPVEHRALSVEWPTIALAVVIHAGWLALTAWHAAVPWPLLVLGGGWLVAWQSSLQHEVIHGHPTPLRRINDAIGFLPLSLWLPYAIYRRDHIAHHAAPHLTDPFDDCESNYLAGPGGLGHVCAALESTLAGRMLLGPPIRAIRFWLGELRRLPANPSGVARDWLPHLVGVALVLLWLDHVGLSLRTYVLCFVWPGLALSLIRSFAEHRASPDPEGRTAIVSDFGPLALLFLFNNLHVWHHARPGAPWYALPAFHRAHPDAFALAPRYAGYGTVFARFLLRPHDRLVHPGR
jgi:fatty acid desaturase